ncbi:unnamed protein product, partial [Didymodactylos carnosus]
DQEEVYMTESLGSLKASRRPSAK